MEETKIIYHIDDEDTPYLIKLPIPSDRVTLGDFKNALNRPNYKFFFKSMDDDFGFVYSFIRWFEYCLCGFLLKYIGITDCCVIVLHDVRLYRVMPFKS